MHFPQLDQASDDAKLAELAARLAAQAAELDRSAAFPHGPLRAFAELGLTGLTVPEALGGGGWGIEPVTRLLARLAAAEPASSLILAMTLIQQALIARNGRLAPHPADQVGRQGVAGAYLNALRVEPELGSPARGGLPATVATRTSSGWRISGHKRFCTGIEGLAMALVWARTDEATPRVGQFLVPVPSEGLTILPSWDHLGMRATGSHDVALAEVEIPADHALDLRPPDQCPYEPESFAWITLPVAALYHGIAEGALGWLTGYLHERQPSSLGAPLASLPRIQMEVGTIEGLLMTSRRLLHSAAAEVDAGRTPGTTELGLIKRSVTGNAIQAVETAVALIGNAALDRKNPLERHLRDVLCARIHTPQDDSVLLAAGRARLDQASRNRSGS